MSNQTAKVSAIAVGGIPEYPWLTEPRRAVLLYLAKRPGFHPTERILSELKPYGVSRYSLIDLERQRVNGPIIAREKKVADPAIQVLPDNENDRTAMRVDTQDAQEGERWGATAAGIALAAAVRAMMAASQ